MQKKFIFRKFINLTVVLFALFSIVACNVGDDLAMTVKSRYNNITPISSLEKPEALSDYDFIIEDDNSFIELGEKYEETKVNSELVEISYLDEKRAYDVYIYEDCTLAVSPDAKENSVIFKINLLSPVFKTFRGIKIGDDISDVIKAYGSADSNNNDSYFYSYSEHKVISFSVNEDGTVMCITLELV